MKKWDPVPQGGTRNQEPWGGTLSRDPKVGP